MTFEVCLSDNLVIYITTALTYVLFRIIGGFENYAGHHSALYAGNFETGFDRTFNSVFNLFTMRFFGKYS